MLLSSTRLTFGKKARPLCRDYLHDDRAQQNRVNVTKRFWRNRESVSFIEPVPSQRNIVRLPRIKHGVSQEAQRSNSRSVVAVLMWASLKIF